MEYAELLHRLTVDCKDDGKHFIKRDRIEAIQSLLADSEYQLLYEGKLVLLYGKVTEKEQSYHTLISSHIDCVYNSCFCREQTATEWIGTFDNSATNAALIDLMQKGAIAPSVLIAFTGDEEQHSNGAREVKQELSRLNAAIQKVIVLDVTNEGWEEEVAFTIENDRGFDILTGFQLVNLLQDSNESCWFLHNAEPDETWEYGKGIDGICDGIPSLSLCLPVAGELHGEQGIILRKSAIRPYENILKELANTPF